MYLLLQILVNVYGFVGIGTSTQGKKFTGSVILIWGRKFALGAPKVAKILEFLFSVVETSYLHIMFLFR